MTDQSLFDQVDHETEQIIAGILRELERRRRARAPEAPPRWWPAIEIARRFGIRERARTDDSRKRGVRLVMDKVAERRDDLIASFRGYALARDAADLSRYRDFRRRMGLAHLQDAGATARSGAADDATGQLRLDEGRGRC